MGRAGARAGIAAVPGALAASAAAAAGEAAEKAAPATDYLALWIKEGPGWWPLFFLLALALLVWKRPGLLDGVTKFSGFGVEIAREVERVEDETLAMEARLQALEAELAALKAAADERAVAVAAKEAGPAGWSGAWAPGGGDVAADALGAERFGGAAKDEGGAPEDGAAWRGMLDGADDGGGSEPFAAPPDAEATPPEPAPFSPAPPAPAPSAPAPAPASPGSGDGAPSEADRLRALLDKALGRKEFTWRSLDRLALETGRTAPEVHRMLAEDPAFVLGKGASGRVIARLASRTPPPPKRRG